MEEERRRRQTHREGGHALIQLQLLRIRIDIIINLWWFTEISFWIGTANYVTFCIEGNIVLLPWRALGVSKSKKRFRPPDVSCMLVFVFVLRSNPSAFDVNDSGVILASLISLWLRVQLGVSKIWNVSFCFVVFVKLLRRFSLVLDVAVSVDLLWWFGLVLDVHLLTVFDLFSYPNHMSLLVLRATSNAIFRCLHGEEFSKIFCQTMVVWRTILCSLGCSGSRVTAAFSSQLSSCRSQVGITIGPLSGSCMDGSGHKLSDVASRHGNAVRRGACSWFIAFCAMCDPHKYWRSKKWDAEKLPSSKPVSSNICLLHVIVNVFAKSILQTRQDKFNERK